MNVIISKNGKTLLSKRYQGFYEFSAEESELRYDVVLLIDILKNYNSSLMRSMMAMYSLSVKYVVLGFISKVLPKVSPFSYFGTI